MNGPARLDLLIPVAKPHGHATPAEESFDDLLRKDEQKGSTPKQGTSRNMPDSRAEHPIPDDLAARSSGPADPVRPIAAETEGDACTGIHIVGDGEAVKIERIYVAHLVAGGYLSARSSHDAIEAVEVPVEPPPQRNQSQAMVSSTEASNVSVTDVAAEQVPPPEPEFEAATIASRLEEDAERSMDNRAGSGPEEAAPPVPEWLPQMARLAVSREGIATLWIRDYTASRDEIAARIAELRSRARSEGLHIGAVMVNGRPWNNHHQGKENDA